MTPGEGQLEVEVRALFWSLGLVLSQELGNRAGRSRQPLFEARRSGVVPQVRGWGEERPGLSPGTLRLQGWEEGGAAREAVKCGWCRERWGEGSGSERADPHPRSSRVPGISEETEGVPWPDKLWTLGWATSIRPSPGLNVLSVYIAVRTTPGRGTFSVPIFQMKEVRLRLVE